MSDTYQPIYDAVRSRISGCDVASVMREVMREAFDVSWQKARLNEAIGMVVSDMTAPHVLMRPSLSVDGDQWCALYGANLQDGVAGFGPSPAEACADFDRAWRASLATHGTTEGGDRG